ncbi:type I restriction-modification system subunit M [Acidimicrobiia bacterium]|nr:type I restriction-modification system subunit M [Acidimicrobiia bacterium]
MDTANLESKLWAVAKKYRAKMESIEFRNYILGFIFFKHLSVKLEHYCDELLKQDNLKFRELDKNTKNYKDVIKALEIESKENLGYFFKPDQLFSIIANKGIQTTDNFILDILNQALKNIEQSTLGTEAEDDFGDLFEDLDLTNSKLGKSESDKNTLVSNIMSKLDEISISSVSDDLLGDAYEYLIKQFADEQKKNAGEFYTPREVSKLMAKIVTVNKKKLKSVYDPTCGSGSLLLRIAEEVDSIGCYYGQESIRTTFNLARMNMLLHNIHYLNFDLKQDDTLKNPLHISEKFEAIVANPPFSHEWDPSESMLQDERFSDYGKLAPKNLADYAFIQHMLYQLEDNGIMVAVMPHGVLFRKNAEKTIRDYIIENQNYLDAVIGLPKNIFYGTPGKTCLLIFKKQREHPDNIMFIDASSEFIKQKKKNKIGEEQINKIFDTYIKRISINKYSRKVSLSEIKDNNNVLSVNKYVENLEIETVRNVPDILTELNQTQKELTKIDNSFNEFLEKLTTK